MNGNFMNGLGIIVAEQEEYNAIVKIINEHESKNVYGLEFIVGYIENVKIVLVRAGVGKVNAARTAQILIDRFDIDYVLNVGSAGSVNDELNIGDVIVARAFGRDKGFIPDVGKYFESDEKLFDKLINLNISNINFKSGVIASGDQFITNIDLKNSIASEFNADCVEMEGGAVAQVCHMAGKAFCIIRAISDKPNGNNNIDFNEFLKLASEKCAKIVYELIKNI